MHKYENLNWLFLLLKKKKILKQYLQKILLKIYITSKNTIKY